MEVLVVEDEQSIRSFIVFNLKRSGFEVVEAETGEEALDLLPKHNARIIVLDVMLPGIDGFEVCRQIRKINQKIGIIMLTARTQEEDRVTGLDIGADDYIPKPFSPAELIARVRSLLRRMKALTDIGDNEVIESGPFRLFTKEERVQKNDQIIALTPTEYEMLRILIVNQGKSLSRHELLDHIWGKSYVGDTKIVDVNISRLRQKIEDDPTCPVYIKTHWGRGYIWGGD